MFEYRAPTQEEEHWSRKCQGNYDTQVRRGLRTMNADNKLSFPKLLAKLRREWPKFERAKMDDGRLSLELMDDVVYVRLAYKVQDGWENTDDRHDAVMMIPFAHYWNIVLWEQPCGQYVIWHRYDQWSVTRTRRLTKAGNM